MMTRVDRPLFRQASNTVSAGWQAFLDAMPDPTTVPMAPDASDKEAWREARIAFNLEHENAANAVLAKYGVSCTSLRFGGVPCLEIRPPCWHDDGRVLVYTHGGVYTLLSARATLESAAMTAVQNRIRVVSIDFTPAPDAQWQEVTDQVVSVFRSLFEQGVDMGATGFFGDCAGGGLAAGSLLKMRDLNMTLPAALFLWSPWLDVTETGDSYHTLREAEPCYRYDRLLQQSAAAYAPAKLQKHPYVSPVYGDFKPGFPPTLIQGGTREIFLSGFVRLYQALDQAQQSVVLDLYEGMPHVFQLARPDSNETKAGMSKIQRFLDLNLRPSQQRLQ